MSLQTLFEFDENDLAANQSGTLSPKQWQQYKAWIPIYRRRLSVFSLIILMIVLLAVFGGLGFYVLSLSDLPQGVKPLIIGALLITPGAILVIRLRSLKQVAERESNLGKVHVITGNVTVHSSDVTEGSLEFWVNNQAFATATPQKPEMQHAFDPNTTYTLYYLDTPIRPMILSIE